MGSLNVLNVGAGDIKLTFNHLDDAEAKKALGILTDMQARGYAILVMLEDGSYARATTVDRARGKYIVQVPGDAPLPAGAEEIPSKAKRGRPRKVAVSVERAKAVGVARSAGG